MRSPYIGKVFAVLVIVFFLGWTAVRSIGAKPAEPKFPFPKPTTDEPLASAKGQEKVVLAGGCFWGVEAVYDHTKGVISAVSGYSGGHVEHPGYEMVSTGLTGHAESVEVTFDPSQMFYRAEDYHQRYLESHMSQPYIVYNDLPKLSNLKKAYPDFYVKN
jgi:peptide-methionine (S)-S-oxide reductase